MAVFFDVEMMALGEAVAKFFLTSSFRAFVVMRFFPDRTGHTSCCWKQPDRNFSRYGRLLCFPFTDGPRTGCRLGVAVSGPAANDVFESEGLKTREFPNDPGADVARECCSSFSDPGRLKDHVEANGTNE